MFINFMKKWVTGVDKKLDLVGFPSLKKYIKTNVFVLENPSHMFV
jgi:hypothetical protein